jgi:acetyl esterase/lipase
MAALALAPEVFRLWSGDAPGALGQAEKDVPTLTLYKPEKQTGTMVVVCPGGGYGMLAQHEGRDYALFLNRLGITAAVLRYRLGSEGYRHPAMLDDAARAVRFARANADKWGIDSKKIGIMGSSAGGHLAATLLTHFEPIAANAEDPVERVSSRPDFGILCYAVITMGPFSHAGSRENLLGKNPSEALLEDLSNEKRVTPQTPPCFIWSTGDDAAVPVQNSLAFAQALAAAKVPYELHVYPHGPHGLGLGGPPDSEKLLPWTNDLRRWLAER